MKAAWAGWRGHCGPGGLGQWACQADQPWCAQRHIVRKPRRRGDPRAGSRLRERGFAQRTHNVCWARQWEARQTPSLAANTWSEKRSVCRAFMPARERSADELAGAFVWGAGAANPDVWLAAVCAGPGRGGGGPAVRPSAKRRRPVVRPILIQRRQSPAEPQPERNAA